MPPPREKLLQARFVAAHVEHYVDSVEATMRKDLGYELSALPQDAASGTAGRILSSDALEKIGRIIDREILYRPIQQGHEWSTTPDEALPTPLKDIEGGEGPEPATPREQLGYAVENLLDDWKRAPENAT